MCKIQKCNAKDTVAVGYCTKHYKRYKKYGDPLYIKKLECLRNYCKDCGFLSGMIVLCDFHKNTRDAMDFGTHEDIFWSHVDRREDPESCWIWRFTIKSVGSYSYGYWDGGARYGTKNAHRIAYILSRKIDIEPYQVVHHKCANSLCQNPRHLQLTDSVNNTAEMLKRQSLLSEISKLVSRRDLLIDAISKAYTPERV